MKCDREDCEKIAVWQVANQYACDRHISELQVVMKGMGWPTEKISLQLKLFNDKEVD